MRSVISGIGELLVTAGMVLILFVVWQIYYVGWTEGNKQAGVVSALEQDFLSGAGPALPIPKNIDASGKSVPTTTTNDSLNKAEKLLAEGQVFAILRIPSLGGPRWAKPIFEGVGADILAKGIGHYPGSQMPGEIGNFSLAGHRSGHGNPLIDIPDVKPGDPLVVETKTAFYVYRMDHYRIVTPSNTDVLAPVPDQPGATATEPWFVLTTCNPRYSSRERWIVYSKLEQVIPHDRGLPTNLGITVGEA